MKRLEILITSAITEVQQELEKHHQGQQALGMPAQLNKYLSNLIAIQDEIRSGDISGKRFGMSKGIVDSWPFDSQLGGKIIDIEKRYNSIKK